MSSSGSIRHRCSVALRLIDSVTGGAPSVSGLKLSLGLLDELNQVTPARSLPPLHGRGLQHKGGGYYAAGALEPGHYVLTVDSPNYVRAQLQLTLEPQSSMPFQAELRLLPSPNYPYAERLTRIRCRCVDAQEQPVAGIELLLHGIQPAAARARLRRAAEAGATELYVRATGVSPVAGESFILLPESSADDESVASVPLERIDIATREDDDEVRLEVSGERCWQLAEPLQHSYRAGASLLSLIQGQSDARGEALLVLPVMPGGATDYRLSTSEGDAAVQAQLTLKEGEALRVELDIASGQARIRNR